VVHVAPCIAVRKGAADGDVTPISVLSQVEKASGVTLPAIKAGFPLVF